MDKVILFNPLSSLRYSSYHKKKYNNLNNFDLLTNILLLLTVHYSKTVEYKQKPRLKIKWIMCV